MNKIRVVPAYGYGWQEGGKSIDVPSPFKVRIEHFKLTDDKQCYAAIWGRIVSFCHEYRGVWILLHLRTRTEPATYYNVRLFDSATAVDPVTLEENPGASFKASGFVEVPGACALQKK